MVSFKKLRNAVFSTVQHSVSGLCFIHPHIGEACLNIGLGEISLELIDLKISPELPNKSKELHLSSEALKNTFVELLEKQGIDITDIEEANIKFFFNNDHWPSGAYISVITKNCKVEHAVDSLGVTAEVINKSN